jgi:hypothetical protein
VPSASRLLPRLAVAACAGSLLVGASAGCSTTQEKAAEHQVESERILDARAARQAKRKQDKDKPGKDGQPRENGGNQQ